MKGIVDLGSMITKDTTELDMKKIIDKQTGVSSTEVAGLVATYQTSGPEGLTKAALESFRSQQAPLSHTATGSGGASTSGDTEVRTASEMAQTQININNQILMALTAVKDTLRNTK